MSGKMLKSFLTVLLLVDVLRTQVCDALGPPSQRNRKIQRDYRNREDQRNLKFQMDQMDLKTQKERVARIVLRQEPQAQATSDTVQTVSSTPLSLRPSGNSSLGNTSVGAWMENVKEEGDVIHVFTDLVGTLDKGATPSPAPPSPCNTTKIAPHERRIVILFTLTIIGIFYFFLKLPRI